MSVAQRAELVTTNRERRRGGRGTISRLRPAHRAPPPGPTDHRLRRPTRADTPVGANEPVRARPNGMMRLVYRVFESLDALVTVVEEARSVPMTAGCIVPRGDVLELLDDVREALPAELDDAQDVLDRRDEIVGVAEEEAARTRSAAQAEADDLRARTRAEVEEALAQARHEAERIVADARRAAASVTDAARDEADRLAAAGQAAHERYVADGRTEQARLVSQTEVVRAARAEAARIVEAAEAEAVRLRHECDAYVDGKLAQFEESLEQALHTVSRGRSTLRRTSPNGAPMPTGVGRTGTGMDLID